ncbi:MAG TPA: HAMP domain-containing histidine kinase [Clostridiales bacterium]|nr:HAMP domain-containing histidine kinase [Clostridiales bacterium]
MPKIKKAKKPLNIKSKIAIYVTISTIIMLVLIWAFNLGFIELFYAESAKGEADKTTKTINKNIDNINNEKDELEDLIKKLATENLFNIAVVNSKNTKSASYTVFSNLKVGYVANLEVFFRNAKANNGRFEDTEEIKIGDDVIRTFLIQTTIIEASDGTEYAVIVEFPITSTKGDFVIIARQLAIVSAILIIMSFAVAYIIGQYVAMPIIDLNESAKHLTTEEVKVNFRGKGYSEIIELKETLNYAKDEITALDKYRKELIANISHDLRTPLALIRGHSEIMRDFPDEVTPENFEIIIAEIDKMTDLVSDMLDLSKLDQSGDTLKLEYFDIVKELKDLYTRRSKLLKNFGYTLEFHADDDKAFVYADSVKILQVIYNLINNAVNYSGEDKLVILRETSTKDKVRIEVIDNGEGISDDVLPNIWDRYYKSEKAHKRADVGTGLGLSIVKSVMGLHPGGVYGVITEEGKGSTFYIELPKIKESDIELDD